jgi:SAM-dependent MidA family methyltransferase
LIDYGHEEAELYAAPHSAGTMTMFKRHTTEADLQDPGTADITAHVDLSAVQRAAESEGMNVLARLDQTYFMMGLGLDELMNSPQGFDASSLPRRLALKTLLLPGGLGSTHKVLVFGKNVGTPKLRCTAYRERLT